MSDYNLSASEREKAFPVHIELGRKETNIPMPESPVAAPKGKRKMYYPQVYIENIPGLEKLPKKGCMLVEFVRKRISIEDGPDGKPAAGVALELHAICLPGDQDGGPASLEDALKQAGKSDDAEPDDSDEDETDEEE